MRTQFKQTGFGSKVDNFMIETKNSLKKENGPLQKFVVTALVLIAVPALILVSIYSYLFDKMQNDANKIIDYFFWMGDYWQITILIMVLATWLTKLLIKVPFSKNSFKKAVIFLVLTVSLAMFMDYRNQQRTLFGKYLYNDGPTGKVVYIDKSPIGLYKRKPGQKIDASNINAAFLVDKGIFPEPIGLSNVKSEDIENGNMSLFENGNPKYYYGTTLKPDGMPRLYDVAGYDPITGNFLLPFDKPQIDAMVSTLKENEGISSYKKRREDEEQSKKDAKEKANADEERRLQDIKELRDKRLQAIQDAKEKAETERAAAAENRRQIALLREERENKAQGERNQRENERRDRVRSEEIRDSRRRIELTYKSNEFTIPAGYDVVERNTSVSIVVNGETVRNPDPDTYKKYDGKVVARTEYCVFCKGDGYIVIQLRN